MYSRSVRALSNDSGLPNDILTYLFSGWDNQPRFGINWLLPQIAMGTTLFPDFKMIREIPLLKVPSLPSSLLVPSGNTTSDFFDDSFMMAVRRVS